MKSSLYEELKEHFPGTLDNNERIIVTLLVSQMQAIDSYNQRAQELDTKAVETEVVNRSMVSLHARNKSTDISDSSVIATIVEGKQKCHETLQGLKDILEGQNKRSLIKIAEQCYNAIRPITISAPNNYLA